MMLVWKLHSTMMTATSKAQAIVACIPQKVEQGILTEDDINELRRVLVENPEVSFIQLK
jgi:hypothetical protein